MEWNKDTYLISDDQNLLQFDRVHRFLSTEAYWSPEIPRETVEKGARNSLAFGIYENNVQVGFARMITDYATFAWLSDVYVEKDHRGKGLSKWLMTCILSHPKLQGLRRIGLATKDAHALYHQFGFKPLKDPSNTLEIKDEEIYKRMKKS